MSNFSDLIAHPDQLAGTRLSRIVGGSGDGSLILTVWTPSGLELDIQVDRALDILSVRNHGVRFGWAGPPGLSPRSTYEPAGFGWQRSFYGGLLTTCGLEHVGDPISGVISEQLPPGSRPISYGEHGRISHSPAELIERSIGEIPGHIRVRGIVRQGAIYDERFELHRTIDVNMELPTITITDVVRNVGRLPARHAILYHLNFGFPVACAQTTVKAGTDRHVFPEPTPEAPELVEQWRIQPNGEGRRKVIVESPDGIPLVTCIQSGTLPYFFLWSAPRAGTNVIGLAPCSSALNGSIDLLQSDEVRTYQIRLELGISQSSGPSPGGPNDSSIS